MTNTPSAGNRFLQRFFTSGHYAAIWASLNKGSWPARTDYYVLFMFIGLLITDALVEVGKVLTAAEQLFWGVWQAKLDSGPQDSELEELFVRGLEEVEAMVSVGPSAAPDYPLREAENPEQFWTMAARFYVSGARAIALVRRFGPNHEDAERCLRESTRLGKLLGAGRETTERYWPLSVARAQAVGLEQLALLEARRDHFSEAMSFYADALDCLVGSLNVVEGEDELSDFAPTAYDVLLSLQRDGWPAIDDDPEGEDTAPVHTPDLLWRSTKGLLNRPSVDNWSQVIADTVRLIENVRALSTWFHDLDWLSEWMNSYQSAPPENMGVTTDDQGQDRDLVSYLLEFRGQAEGRLSPDELQKVLAADRAAGAKERLRTYFFPNELWEWGLTPNARNALISADRELFADTGLTEHIFDLLQQATEDLCHEIVWEPLERSQEGLLSAANKYLSLSDRTPGARHYAWACGHLNLGKALARYDLDAADLQFLTGRPVAGPATLPGALNELRSRFRNPARHDREAKFGRDEVSDKYFRFVGVNRNGILPKLARIRWKMRKKDAEGVRETPSVPTSPN